MPRKWIFQLAPRQVETVRLLAVSLLHLQVLARQVFLCILDYEQKYYYHIILYGYFFSLPSYTSSKFSISYLLFVFLHSNNNRSGRKITGKKFQPLMSQDMTERSDVTDSSYSCSPSKQGPLRLKLSSGYLLV